MSKPIICVDFDGVLHAYSSGWQGADVIPDGMVEGADVFLDRAVRDFTVAIHSSRSCQPNGIKAMQFWLKLQLYKRMDTQLADEIYSLITWPTEKPPALVTIDDRAMTFKGVFPSTEEIQAFRPWYKQEPAA